MTDITFEEYKLSLPLDATFADLKLFLTQNAEVATEFDEFYLVEMSDSGSFEMAQEFQNLLDGDSEERIVDFFVKHEQLSEPVVTNAGDDLDTFFHTIFT